MSIEQRGPNSWRITVSAGIDAKTKQRRRIRKTIKGDRAAAQREEMRIMLEVGDGLPTEFSLTATVASLLETWLPVADLSPKTRYDYRLVIDKYIGPGIGDMPLHKLRAVHLDRFYAQMAEHVGPDRIRRAHTILSGALGRAVKWEWISRNPALDATQPKAPDRDPESPTPDEYRHLVAVANDTLLRTAVAIHLAAHLGSRLGEVCGLQWSDLKLDAIPPTARVVRTVGTVPGVGEVIKPIKGNSRRHREPKPLDEATVALLRLWDMATAEERAAGANPHQWVFLAPKKLSFYRPGIMGRDFKAVAKAAGLDHLTMHKLRHYVVAQLRAAGIDIDAISRRVGHSRTSTTTDLYGGPVTEQAMIAARTIAAINRGDG